MISVYNDYCLNNTETERKKNCFDLGNRQRACFAFNTFEVCLLPYLSISAYLQICLGDLSIDGSYSIE